MSTLPLISDVDTALYKVDAMMGAAEAHGALCGMLCAQGSIDLSEWSDHVLGEQDPSNVLLHDVVHVLSALHQNTLEQLNDAMAEFNLLLPDEEEELAMRVEELANWCQGFVYGLAAGGIKQDTELPTDSSELIHDMIEISRAGHDEELVDEGDAEEDSDEDNEVAYMEITEYVRTGILLIHEELQPLQSNSTIQ
jgi:yecA family protein